MRKEWFVALGVTVITVAVALGLIRLLAPQLLGVSRDLQLVQASKEVSPFFDNIFRREDYQGQEFIIQDPYVKRAKPLFPEYLAGMGPHDILGFRNRMIPNIADVVTIGDSQTYGNNALLVDNWPSQLQTALASKRVVIYNMAVGGWGAAEYLAIFDKVLLFQPRVIVVAFYTGNDPLETFQQVYGNSHYAFLRPNSKLNAHDVPQVTFPAPESEWWPVTFKDGTTTIFTPKLRHASNQNHPAVRAGYAIMAETGRLMGELARKHQVKLIFTIIPTKELAYAAKIAAEGMNPPPDYAALIANEGENSHRLADELRRIPEATVVDVIGPLQKAAKASVPLYPADINGHPVAAGYAVIAKVLTDAINPLLPAPLDGLTAIQRSPSEYSVFLVRDGNAWIVPSPEIAKQNGWSLENIPLSDEQQLNRLPFAGTLDFNPGRFGPLH